jgi:hypothetical protein
MCSVQMCSVQICMIIKLRISFVYLFLSGEVISCTKFKSSQEYEQIRSGRSSLSSHRIREELNPVAELKNATRHSKLPWHIDSSYSGIF